MKRKKRAGKFWRELEETPPPLPAFRSFTETESIGYKRLKCYGTSDAVDGFLELDGLFMDATGRPSKWHCCWNEAGEIIYREKHKPREKKDAAEALIRLTLDGVSLVSRLYEKDPNLCRNAARTLAQWPVSADMTEKSWQRKAVKVVEDLNLGSAIGGFILSARTAAENPIRRYAMTIYDTLFQTRWLFKEANNRGYQRQGCPPWAAKTLALPQFTKTSMRPWADLGKEMLLEQRANFLEDETLKEQKFKWTKRAENRSKSGRPTLRAIQNEAYDDFTKELRKLAPPENIYRGDW